MEIEDELKQQLVTRIRQRLVPFPNGYPHIAVTAPSGAGKTTLIRTDEKSIINLEPDIFEFSRSGANRDIRAGEQHEVDYMFMTTADFGVYDFFETNDYGGNKKLYGTLITEMERIVFCLKKQMVLDIDMNGAIKMKKWFGDDLFTVNLEITEKALRKRLIGRAEKTGESIEEVEKRLKYAEQERIAVRNGTFVPDLIIEYDDMPTGEAASLILYKAKEMILRKKLLKF